MTIEYKGKKYPKFQTEGNAAQFALPYAKHICKGNGIDVGCNRKEWAYGYDEGWCYDNISLYESSTLGNKVLLVDPVINGYKADEIPIQNLDFVFSSHCLEHLNDWVSILDYWISLLKKGGVLFLYLPAYSQEYWRPWNNRKHMNIFSPEILRDYFEHKNFSDIFVSGEDLNNAFMIFGVKQ